MAACPVFVPVHSGRSHSRLLFGLFLFWTHSAVPQPLLSPQAVSGKGPLEKKDGTALAQGLGEARKSPHIPLFSLLKPVLPPEAIQDKFGHS